MFLRDCRKRSHRIISFEGDDLTGYDNDKSFVIYNKLFSTLHFFEFSRSQFDDILLLCSVDLIKFSFTVTLN